MNHGNALSLVSEGQRSGLLDQREAVRIQYELLELLQELIGRYTQGESSSVSVDTAERLLASAVYALDAHLKSLKAPGEAITALKSADIRTLHAQGVERIRQVLEEVRRLYLEVRKNRLDVPVDAYNATIDEALPAFLKKYDILFDAHNTMASIDYPLAVDDMRLQGVFYIKQYLERLHIEDQFCRQWERDELILLLENYGRVCRFDYRIELFNIFELVFHHALFSVLSGGDVRRILISPVQYARLEHLFIHADAAAVDAMIRRAVDGLLEQLPPQEPGTEDYLKQCCPDLVRRIVNAAEHRNLQAVIIADRQERVSPAVISLKPGGGMSDARLRRLLDDIGNSESTEDKVRLIREKFQSLHDYLDLLESGCLYGEEYEALYDAFGEMELAVLCKIVFREELRGGTAELADIIREREETEHEWQHQLIEYMKRQDDRRIRTVDEWIGRIDYEDISFY
jgi:hypothetical protein